MRRTVEASIKGEQPHVFPEPPDLTEFFPNSAPARLYGSQPTDPLPMVGVAFTNIGRTACVIRAQRVETFLGKDLPAVPTFTYADEISGETICQSNVKIEQIGFEHNKHLSKAEIRAARDGTAPVNVFGYIRYVDIFGRLHTKGFCLRTDFQDGRPYVHAVGGKAYNYRKVKPAPTNMML